MTNDPWPVRGPAERGPGAGARPADTVSDHVLTDDALPPVLADAVARLAPAPAVPEAAVAAVMARVWGRPAPGVPARARPRAWAVLTSAASLAAVLLVAALIGERARRDVPAGGRAHGGVTDGGVADGGAAGPVRTDAVPTHEVRFHVAAGAVSPAGRRVAVVGDFNAWDGAATPLRRDPTGAWSVRVWLPAGRYVYAFVVDGREWLADPRAPLAPADGFGRQNSVLLVAPQLALSAP